MSCNKFRPKLELHAGDDLDGREAAEVSAHLKSCLACFREYTELRDMLAVVRSTGFDRARGDAEVESIVAGVMRGIDGPPPAAPRLLARLSLVSGWAAAILLAVTLGWQAFTGGRVATPPRTGPEPVLIDHRWNGRGPIPASLEADLDEQFDELRKSRGIRVRPTVIPAAGGPQTKRF
jgi:anti-sigma factor RsiW